VAFLTNLTLEDLGRPGAAPQPLPVAVAFFTAESVKSFLKELLSRVEDGEGWDLPDTVKKSVVRDGAVGAKAIDDDVEAAS
jgi:hypothetical protein